MWNKSPFNKCAVKGLLRRSENPSTHHAHVCSFHAVYWTTLHTLSSVLGIYHSVTNMKSTGLCFYSIHSTKKLRDHCCRLKSFVQTFRLGCCDTQDYILVLEHAAKTTAHQMWPEISRVIFGRGLHQVAAYRPQGPAPEEYQSSSWQIFSMSLRHQTPVVCSNLFTTSSLTSQTRFPVCPHSERQVCLSRSQAVISAMCSVSVLLLCHC